MTAFANRWYLGSRPRTLPAAVVPVVMGTAVATSMGPVEWWRAAAALVVALALQIATNFANDYSDGIRGTDNDRVGPVRLVASGLASPRSVKTAAFLAFGVAGVAGTALALAVEPLLIPLIGIPSVLAGWFYTGGSRPYGYTGLGEASVFVFFGLAATLGSQYVQHQQITLLGVLAAICAGLLAVALLVVNNLRDLSGDSKAGKLTLAVRIGDRYTRILYVACILTPFALVVVAATDRTWIALALLAVVLSIVPVRNVIRGDKGSSLIATLGATAALQLGFATLFSLGAVL